MTDKREERLKREAERLKREAAEKIAAFAQYHKISVDSVEKSEYDDMWLTHDGEDWEVLTDQEADDRLEDYLDYYIDDEIIPELPEAYQCFFYSEKWKDIQRAENRGHYIGDNSEEERHVRINNTDYYLYKQ